MKQLFFCLAVATLCVFASRSSAADVTCQITPTPPPIDCSMGASLKRGWTPHVCRVS